MGGGPLAALRNCKGVSAYHNLVREGVNTRGANGVYWVEVLQERPGGRLLIENQDASRKNAVGKHQATAEGDLVFPLCRGRDIARWLVTPKQSIIVPYRPGKGSKPLSEQVMRREYPLTFAFLNSFRTVLSKRKKFRNFDPASNAFYEMYDVGEYTFQPYKVIYKGEVATDLVAAVAPQLHHCGRELPVVPDQTAHCKRRSRSAALAGREV